MTYAIDSCHATFLPFPCTIFCFRMLEVEIYQVHLTEAFASSQLHLDQGLTSSMPNKPYAQAPQVNDIPYHRPVKMGTSQVESCMLFYKPKQLHRASKTNLSSMDKQLSLRCA